MLTIHHADELEPLLDGLAELLRVPPADPFTPDVVVVPAAGMQDAVMAGLGTRLGSTGRGDGIVANIDFIFPGTFVSRAVGGVDDDPWSIDRLTWYVLEVIIERPGLLPWVAPGAPVVNPWATARRIADLFDRYASQRPQMLVAWNAGTFSDGTMLGDNSPAMLPSAQRWQPVLWCAVRERIAQPSPPERLAAWLGDSDARIPALPARVYIFGFGSLSSIMLTALRGLAPLLDVHVFLRVPSRVAWKRSAAEGSADSARPPDSVQHPLLLSWGRPALDTRILVDRLEGAVIRPAHRPLDEPTTVLGALQDGIRLDEQPSRVEVPKDDQSFQVHACHGALRQLEVLRDALGHAFVSIPNLAGHEVLVLCPDIEQYAPLVESVLGRGALPVPVHVGDRALTSEEPIHAAVQGVLSIVGGRASLSEVLSLAQLDPVRRAFGWSVEDVERLSQWCTTTGTRWGLTPDLRTEWLARDSSGNDGGASQWDAMGGVTTGTWDAMCKRLLTGVAMTAPAPRLALGGVVPYDDMGADEVRLAGSLADFLAHLVDLARFVASPHPLHEWVDMLHALVDDFCAVGRNDSWRIDAVHGDLDDLVEQASTGTEAERPVCAVPLALTDISAALAKLLADRPGRVRLRTGAVTVTSTVPMRGVSARVVAVLGLDDDAMRVGGADGDDVLGINPCVGDRSPRSESRHLLLDAVLAAQERLIITCNGADLTTNKETPFTVALTELLEVVRTLRGNLDKPAVVRHPRHVFNEQTMLDGELVPGVRFTFDPAAVVAAEVRRKALAAAAAGAMTGDGPAWTLPPRVIHEVTLDDLVAAVMNPARSYLRERLDLVLPGSEEVLDDNLSVSIGPLEQAGLGRRLFEAVRQQHELDAWRIPVQHEGTLPPGDLGTVGLDRVIAEVTDLLQALLDWGIEGSPDDHREIDVDDLIDEPIDEAVDDVAQAVSPSSGDQSGPTPPVLGKLRLVGEVHGLYGTVLAEFRFAKPRPSYRLGLAVRLAALQYAHPSSDWQAVLVRRAAGSEVPIDVLRIAGTGKTRRDNAAALLRCALHVYEWALRDAVPLFERASEPLHRGGVSKALGPFKTDVKNNEWVNLLWGGIAFDEIVEAPLLDTDPQEVHLAADPGDGDADEWLGRGAATASWVWGTYGDTIEVYDHKKKEFGPASGAALQVEEEDNDDE